jgi:hypothetical protein
MHGPPLLPMNNQGQRATRQLRIALAATGESEAHSNTKARPDRRSCAFATALSVFSSPLPAGRGDI